MKKYLLITLFLFSITKVVAAGDTVSVRRHTIYVMPSSFLRDLFSFSGFTTIWCIAGYDYRINKKNYIGFNGGGIIYSQKSAGGLLEKPADKLNGYLINIEHKFILKSRFYYSTNITYEYRKIYESERLFPKSTDTSLYQYKILYNTFSLTPKIGFAIYARNNMYCDFGIGIGISHIKGITTGKINQSYSYISDNRGNRFGDEEKIYPNILLQFKIGYNF